MDNIKPESETSETRENPPVSEESGRRSGEGRDCRCW